MTTDAPSPPAPSLIVVEDDARFAATLARSFERRGYRVQVAAGPPEVEAVLIETTPDYAVVDLKLQSSSGLSCVKQLHDHSPATRIVVLTGFASITTAVEAIKLGACHYLAKPASTDDIEAAFGHEVGDVSVPVTPRHTSLKTLEWERINEVLVETDYNISETARRLGLHRRTLARKLAKRPVP